MVSLSALRKELESRYGPIPDQAWARLVQTVEGDTPPDGAIADDDRDDFMASAHDFLGVAVLYAGAAPRAGRRKPRLRKPRGTYRKSRLDRIGLVNLVEVCKIAASVHGIHGNPWPRYAKALKQIGAWHGTPQALERAYYRGRRDYESYQPFEGLRDAVRRRLDAHRTAAVKEAESAAKHLERFAEHRLRYKAEVQHLKQVARDLREHRTASDQPGSAKASTTIAQETSGTQERTDRGARATRQEAVPAPTAGKKGKSSSTQE